MHFDGWLPVPILKTCSAYLTSKDHYAVVDAAFGAYRLTLVAPNGSPLGPVETKPKGKWTNLVCTRFCHVLANNHNHS